MDPLLAEVLALAPLVGWLLWRTRRPESEPERQPVDWVAVAEVEHELWPEDGPWAHSCRDTWRQVEACAETPAGQEEKALAATGWGPWTGDGRVWVDPRPEPGDGGPYDEYEVVDGTGAVVSTYRVPRPREDAWADCCESGTCRACTGW